MAGRSARTCHRRSPGVSGSAIFGLAIAGSGKSFIDELGKATDFVKLHQQRLSRLRHPVASAGSCSSLFVEFGMILAWPRRGDARRDLGVRRDVRAARVPARDAAVDGPLGDAPAASP